MPAQSYELQTASLRETSLLTQPNSTPFYKTILFLLITYPRLSDLLIITSMKHLQFETISTSSDQSQKDNQDSDTLACGACQEGYDLSDKVPFVICEQDHVLCRRCAFKLYATHAKKESVKCEFCQTLLQWPQFQHNLINLLKRKAQQKSKLNQQKLSLCNFSIQETVRTILIENQDLQGEVEVEEEVLEWPCFIGQPLTSKLHQFEITSPLNEITHINLGFTTPQDVFVFSFEERAVISRQGVCHTDFNNHSIQEIIDSIAARVPPDSQRVTIRMKLDASQQQISWFLQEELLLSLPLPSNEDKLRPYFEYKHRCQSRGQ